jgi:peptide/nickel transport system ATP-binding protein
MLVKLLDATEGTMQFNDGDYERDVAKVGRSEISEFRSRVQMIFQDPYESMNPRRTVFDTVAEPLAVQKIGTIPEREERVLDLLRLVGLTPPEAFLFRYPHELSGGQRQRIAIARALVMNPRFVVADEPTSMLDVSIRISIMELMTELGDELGVSYLYITHDLAVARYMCDRIAVMYLGKIVEMGPTEEILARPQHPYTKALLSAVPVPDPSIRRTPVEIKGGISKAINPPPECRFIERCPFAAEVCRTNPHPPLEEVGDRHLVACYRVDEINRELEAKQRELDARAV